MNVYISNEDMCSLKRGSKFIMADAYALEICDICGKKRKCEWLEYRGNGFTGLDVCRSCLREKFEKVEE